LASVGVDDVRDVINVSSAEVPDAKVLKMIKRTVVTLELETEKETDQPLRKKKALRQCFLLLLKFTSQPRNAGWWWR